jgi:tetratricopeptide (TPR) repeat protein
MKTEWKPLAVRAAVIVLATLLVYIPAMQAKFIWDDNLLLTQFPVMHSDKGLGVFWWPPASLENQVPDYYPVTWSTLWLEWRLWGQNATGYHVTNVITHAIGSVLVWLALKRLGVPGALLAGLVFAIHPVNVASVAWIVERKNTLSIIFYLLTVIFYLRFEDTSRQKWYFLSLGMFVLALLSKTSVVTTPVVLLLCTWWRRNRISLKDLARTVPFFALAGVLACATVRFQTQNVIHNEVIREANEKGLWRLAVAGTAPWFYLYKALIPHQLLMIYPRWNIDPGSIVSYLPGLALVACLAVLLAFRKTRARAVLFASAYFLVTLLPVLGFFDMYYMTHSLVADHWQYVSIIAVIALVIAGAHRLLSRWRDAGRKAGIAIAAIVVGVLAVLTWNQTIVYEDQVTLWEYNLAMNPNAWMGQYNLGTTYGERSLATEDAPERNELLKKASVHLAEAARLKPTYSPAFNNLGLTLMNMGKFEEAIVDYRKAIELDPNNAQAYGNLGLALIRAGRDQEAIPELTKARALAPHYADPVFRLGLLMAKQGKAQEAISYFTGALGADPMHCEAYYQRGIECLKLGMVNEAAADLRRAISIRPDIVPALYQLGLLAQREGRLEEARHYYVRTLLFEPGFLDARYRLGLVLADLGLLQEAISDLTMVVRSKPDFAEALGNLGRMLLGAGRPQEAVPHFRKALELRPGWVELMSALARVLVTSGEPNAANAQEAVRLAEKAAELTSYSQSSVLDTLAAAYADAGRFDAAVRTQQKVLDLLGQSADKGFAEAAANRLLIYKAGRTLRQGPAPGGNPTPQAPKRT